jgi:hypothetical protein
VRRNFLSAGVTAIDLAFAIASVGTGDSAEADGGNLLVLSSNGYRAVLEGRAAVERRRAASWP